MHFHLGWSGPAKGFGHGGYYTRDGCYIHIGHQQGKEALGQENRTMRNAKPDHSVFQKAATTLGRQQGQRAPNEPPIDHLGGSQEKTEPENESSANDKVKSDAVKNPEEAITEQSKVSGAKTETRTEAGTSSRRPQNRTVRFSKPDHLVSAASGQKKASKTSAPGTALAPRWCPPGFTPSQRRRIQRMRA
jgi:hypothetical protein